MSKGTLFGFIAAVCVVLGSILSATDKRSRPFVLWAKPSAVTRIPKPR